MTILINSQTVAKAAFEVAEKVVLTSPTFTVGGVLSNSNGIRVFVDYESFTPDGDATPNVDRIQAVLEEEVAPGAWLPIATQDKEVAAEMTKARQILTLSPAFVDAGQNVLVIQSGADQIHNSRHHGRLTQGGVFRVRFLLIPQSVDLESVTLSVNYTPFEI